jgi:long-chain acyl-CoA synthetase
VDKVQEKQLYEKLYQDVLVNGKLIFVGSLLQRAAQLFPDNVALICEKDQLTYKELYRRTLAFTQKLVARGIKPRDRVCIWFENSIEFYIGYYGAWQAGAVVAPLNTFLHEKELNHIAVDAKPTAMIVSQKLAESVKQIAPHIFTEQDMQDSSDADSYVIPALEPDEVAALLYTSGTTGLPKGVMLSSKNIMTGMLQGVARLKVVSGVRVFGVLPFFHSFAQMACIWGPFLVGASVIIVPKIERHAMREGLTHKPTIMLGVPGLYAIACMLNMNFDSVDYFFCGGDALPDKVRSMFELVYQRKLCNGYGLTESSPVISIKMEDLLLPTHCVGEPLAEVSTSIRDEQGNELKQGEIGILWVKAPNVMLGYYNLPELTQQTLKDGWLNTGDFGYLDQEGRLYISGRHKDLIVNKGVKIYPQEIENVLLTHPAVTGVGVIGKPDLEAGETVLACVEVKSPTPTIEAELRELCERDLSNYKIPRQFIILSALPRTPLGKVDKKVLKAEYGKSDN